MVLIFSNQDVDNVRLRKGMRQWRWEFREALSIFFHRRVLIAFRPSAVELAMQTVWQDRLEKNSSIHHGRNDEK